MSPQTESTAWLPQPPVAEASCRAQDDSARAPVPETSSDTEADGPRSATEQSMDPWLFFAAIALCALGLVLVYSAGAWLGHHLTGDWEHFLRRHAIFVGLGIPGMLVLSRIDYRLLRRFGPHLMLVALAFLVLVLFVGQEVNGARRWIRVGSVGLQPSELAKLALAVFLSSTLARQGERVRRFKNGFLPVVGVAGLTMILILAERDLGTTILVGALTLVTLFVAGTRVSYVVAAVMVAAPIAWYQILSVEFRRGRLEEFVSGDSYQVQQALIGVGSGGLGGLGLGQGRQKLGFLPENHTDFILATVGEELGLLGILLVMSLLALFVWRGFRVAAHAQDRFGTYLAASLTCLFGLQALVNFAVVLEVIPAKGLTLPFLSYGGSSLLASLAAAGILLAVSRNPAPWQWSDQRGRSGPRLPRVRPKKPSGARRNARRQPPASDD